MKPEDIEQYTLMANALDDSSYQMTAPGVRGVSVSELAAILKILTEEDPHRILEKLEELHKYAPGTIEMDKAQMERQHCYQGELCNCYIIDLPVEKYYCQIKKKERIETTDKRNYKEYFQWRESVFIRDDYTCQDCGQRGGELNAHHVKSYKKHPKLRLDVDNGITLCVCCHKKIKR